jgi:hypothetical protein
MPKTLAVLVIHGIGSQAPGYSAAMQAKADARIAQLGRDPLHIAWKEIYWADILHVRQEQYLSDAGQANKLDYLWLRRWVVSALGDASAYQQIRTASNNTYELIHARIQTGLNELFTNDLGGTERPLVIMAHSLGGHIISNYIWDVQHAAPGSQHANAFENLDTLVGLITFGCNLPLFTFAYTQVVPITFPPPGLPPDLLAKRPEWINFYDPDDVLGYPLKPLNAAYAGVVARDIEINAGGLLTSWNPASHDQYWTDNDLTAPAAELIARFL